MEWKLGSSFSGDKEHSLLYRSEYKGVGVQLEIHTPVKKNKHYADPDRFGNPKRYFFAEGDEREFKTEGELTAAIDAYDEVTLRRRQKGAK